MTSHRPPFVRYQPLRVSRYLQVLASNTEAFGYGFLLKAGAKPQLPWAPYQARNGSPVQVDIELPHVMTPDGRWPLLDVKSRLEEPWAHDRLAEAAKVACRPLLILHPWQQVVWRTTWEGGLLPVAYWFHQSADGVIRLVAKDSGEVWDGLWWEAEPGAIVTAYREARMDAMQYGLPAQPRQLPLPS